HPLSMTSPRTLLFSFTHPSTSAIYTLSLHDALPICEPSHLSASNLEHLPRYILDSASAGLASVTGLSRGTVAGTYTRGHVLLGVDRKSTRLNSSHSQISYAVFCLKKKKKSL